MTGFELFERLEKDLLLFVKDIIACGIQKAAMAQVVKGRHRDDYLDIFKRARAEVVDAMSDDDLLWTWQNVSTEKLPAPTCIEQEMWETFGVGSVESELEIARQLCDVASKFGLLDILNSMNKELGNGDGN